MALAEIRLWSCALQKSTAMSLLLPGPFKERPDSSNPALSTRHSGLSTKNRYPVLYLLGGLSDDHTIWHRRTRIEWYVRDLPLIVVMPNGERGFYTNAVAGFAHERHIIEDVIGFVDDFLPTIAERRGRVIAGLSMGGYGAMKLALKHPDMFCGAVAHSGCHAIVRNFALHGKMLEDETLTDEVARIFGSPPNPDDDPFRLAERADRSLLPAIRFDCGLNDFLIQHSRDLHAHFERLAIPHEYEEFPGEHTWDYWDQHIREAIAFHCKALGIAA